MKAYNPASVQNRAIRQQAERWQREGLLNPEQLTAIQEAYPVPFRDSNVFAEVGSFMFTVIAVGGAYALILLFMSGLVENSLGFGIFNLLVGAGLLAFGYSLIRNSKFYRNGPDNALIVLAVSCWLAAINTLLPNETAFWFRCLLAVPVLLLFTLYFADVIVTFMAIVALYAAVFDLLLEFDWGRAALPFVLMALSLVIKLLVDRLKPQLSETNQIYYTDALSMVEWLSMIGLAAAGNYFVVRELNGLLIEVPPGQARPEEAPQISLAGLFWLLTFAIPGTYLYLGLTRKSRMFLILGVLGMGAAISTVRNYFAVIPLSVYLTILGSIAIGAAVWAIRSLRQPRFGFTDVPDEESPRQFFLNSEIEKR